MSEARRKLHAELVALEQATSNSSVIGGATTGATSGESVLRRGACITALVMLEAFLRDRTEEILGEFQSWPASFDDLPKRLRSRATIEALPHIEKFAKMLKRQDEDFEALIFDQVGKMSSANPPSILFTKFVAGDYTGNISEMSVEDLLKALQIKDCWNGFRKLGADVGIGVPSVKEILRTIVRNRHRSAHVSGFNPTASDVGQLPQGIRLIAICIDAAMSASARAAISDWRAWTDDRFDWLSCLDLYFVEPSKGRYKLMRKGASRAVKIVDQPASAAAHLPHNRSGTVRLLVVKGQDGTPVSWSLH